MSSLVTDRSGPRFAVPETVLAYLRRDLREVLEIAPELSERECLDLITDVAVFDALVFRIAERAKNRREYEARLRLPAPDRKPPQRASPPSASMAVSQEAPRWLRKA